MSLVERALKKLQESGPGRTATPVQPVPVLSQPAAVTAPHDTPAAAAPVRRVAPPSRIVKIDREALRAIHLLPMPTMERRIAAQYQHVKRPLLASALNRGPDAPANANVIMLTSALPGEGKTFTSINLALSMALEKDLEVLLVDGDVAKPNVSRLFGLQSEAGLLDLLTDGTRHADSAILRTDVPGLSILPAGRQIETATELLASEHMKQVIAELTAPGRRRVVLIDSPPLLLSTESIALLGSVGQILMVVRAEATPRKAVLDALELVGERRVSLMLNQSSAAPASGYYGYGIYGDSAQDKTS
jgi:exopolysaccharide/PEP-CTERM locus tyrosine autokinase